MTADAKSNFGDDAVEKLKEIGWFVAIALIRWLLERLTSGNPGPGETDAETEHER